MGGTRFSTSPMKQVELTSPNRAQGNEYEEKDRDTNQEFLPVTCKMTGGQQEKGR